MSERDSFEVFMEALARYCLTSPIPRSSDAETTEAMQQEALAGAKPLFDEALNEAILRISECDAEPESPNEVEPSREQLEADIRSLNKRLDIVTCERDGAYRKMGQQQHALKHLNAKIARDPYTDARKARASRGRAVSEKNAARQRCNKLAAEIVILREALEKVGRGRCAVFDPAKRCGVSEPCPTGPYCEACWNALEATAGDGDR